MIKNIYTVGVSLNSKINNLADINESFINKVKINGIQIVPLDGRYSDIGKIPIPLDLIK